MAKHMVEVRNLTKKYNDKIAVNGISFEVKKGEIFGILGPNGAGKTTTLEMIETIRDFDSGSITVDGLDVAKHPQKVKYVIGVQPQSPAFMDKVKLTEQLEQLASAYGSRVNAKRLLAEVGLTDKASAYVENLSGGQAWTFPKGHPEAGETHEQSALREVVEETGWECSVVRQLTDVFYRYTHDKVVFNKTVRWFLMTPLKNRGVFDVEEVLEIKWVPLDEAAALVSYGSDKELLKQTTLLL